MSGRDLDLALDLEASAADLYRALTTEEGIAGWWTAECEMDAREGGRATFRFPGAGFFVEVEIVRLVPGRRQGQTSGPLAGSRSEESLSWPYDPSAAALTATTM